MIDATNVQPEARKPLVALARGARRAAGRDRARPARAALPRAQRGRGPIATSARTSSASRSQQLRRSLKALRTRRLPPRLRRSTIRRRSRRPRSSGSRSGTTGAHERGPFDIIGDVHGCCDELEELLAQLGYARADGRRLCRIRPAARRSFVGDLVDRGPRVVDALRIWCGRWSQAGSGALRARQSRREAAAQAARARDVQITHGLAADARGDRRAAARAARTLAMPSCTTFLDRSSATTCSTTAGSSSPTPA